MKPKVKEVKELPSTLPSEKKEETTIPPKRTGHEKKPPGSPSTLSTFWTLAKNLVMMLVPFVLIGVILVAITVFLIDFLKGKKSGGVNQISQTSEITKSGSGDDQPSIIVTDTPRNENVGNPTKSTNSVDFSKIPISLGSITGSNTIVLQTGDGRITMVTDGGTIIGSGEFRSETTNQYAVRNGRAPAENALPGITLPDRKIVGPTQVQATLKPGEYATIVRAKEMHGFQLTLESPQGLTDWCKNHGELPTGTLVQNVSSETVTFRVNRFQ